MLSRAESSIRRVDQIFAGRSIDLPSDPGVYAFWWVGDRATLMGGKSTYRAQAWILSDEIPTELAQRSARVVPLHVDLVGEEGDERQRDEEGKRGEL